MPVLVSLLRGINVGGHHMVPMEPLRKLYANCGALAAQTYLQSGNVVFQAGGDVAAVTKRIGNGIERSFGFRPEIIVRTAAEMREVVARNPFAARPELEPNKLAVVFLATLPTADARKKLASINAEPEEFRLAGRELYVYYTGGMGRAKLSGPLIEKTLNTAATARNWNTVRKLLEIAEQMEAQRA
jgi:uncharacterized protein (DUF1697 family)